jgi:hypothetical protein
MMRVDSYRFSNTPINQAISNSESAVSLQGDNILWQVNIRERMLCLLIDLFERISEVITVRIFFLEDRLELQISLRGFCSTRGTILCKNPV